MGTIRMATTGVRLTMKFNFFQQIRGAGWSESYDLGYSNLATAVSAIANVNAFIVDRVNCLGIGPILVEAVLSAFTQPLAPGDPPAHRSSLSIQVPPAPVPGSAYNKALSPLPVDGKQPYDADFAPTVYYIALATNLSDTPVYRRNCWIAGLPDTADETDSPNILDAPTLTAIKRFLVDLANFTGGQGPAPNGSKNNVSIRSVDRSGANPIKKCQAWNINVNTYTVNAHGFVPGQPIIAEGCRTAPGGSCPRGVYLVAATPDANTISLQNSAPPSLPTAFGGFRACFHVQHSRTGGRSRFHETQ